MMYNTIFLFLRPQMWVCSVKRSPCIPVQRRHVFIYARYRRGHRHRLFAAALKVEQNNANFTAVYFIISLSYIYR